MKHGVCLFFDDTLVTLVRHWLGWSTFKAFTYLKIKLKVEKKSQNDVFFTLASIYEGCQFNVNRHVICLAPCSIISFILLGSMEIFFLHSFSFLDTLAYFPKHCSGYIKLSDLFSISYKSREIKQLLTRSRSRLQRKHKSIKNEQYKWQD